MVEQLVMIGTRLAILEQEHLKSTNNLRWHDSRAVSEELLSPDSGTLGGLKAEITKWRRRNAGDASPVDNMDYTHFVT